MAIGVRHLLDKITLRLNAFTYLNAHECRTSYPRSRDFCAQ